MKLSEIMKQYRNVHNISTRAFAEKVGCTNAYISLLENDKIKSPSIDTIKNIAIAMGIELDTLLEMMDDMNISIKTPDSQIYKSAGIDYIRIPLYSNLCCGDGGFVDDNILEYVPVPNKGLSIHCEYFAQIADGNSMKDAGIIHGDLLIFEKTNRVENGVIGCFCVDENMATCKKYSELNSMIALLPMNSDFDIIFVDPLNSSFKCLGRLKKIIKDVE